MHRATPCMRSSSFVIEGFLFPSLVFSVSSCSASESMLALVTGACASMGYPTPATVAYSGTVASAKSALYCFVFSPVTLVIAAILEKSMSALEKWGCACPLLVPE